MPPTVLALVMVSIAVYCSCYGNDNASVLSEREDLLELSRIPRAVMTTRQSSNPSIVMIEVRTMIKTKPFKKVLCTGNIVTTYMVLTAANCAYEVDTRERISTANLYIYAGYRDYQTPFLNPSIGKQVSEILMHPEFVCCDRNDFDVALFKTSSAFEFSSTVGRIRLTTSPFKGRRDCSVTGYGSDNTTFEYVEDGLWFVKDLYNITMRSVSVTKKCECSRPLKKKKKNQILRKPFICQHVYYNWIEVSIADRGAGLVCGGTVFGMFTGYLSSEYRASCARDASININTKINTITDKNYTLTFTDLCLTLSWINKHADIFSKKQVSKNCGENYIKQWRKMYRGTDSYLSRRGLAARPSLSITTALLSSMIIFKSIIYSKFI